MWKQTFLALNTRGSRNQDLRKTEGHATQEDIAAGITTEVDKKGNGKSDQLVDEGVEMINGKGLAALGKWTADRHDRYNKCMRRVHGMIVAVTLLEKTERDKADKAQATILGWPGDLGRNGRADKG